MNLRNETISDKNEKIEVGDLVTIKAKLDYGPKKFLVISTDSIGGFCELLAFCPDSKVQILTLNVSLLSLCKEKDNRQYTVYSYDGICESTIGLPHLAMIKNYINQGKKIEAIKVLRSIVDCDLMKAKNWIEGYMVYIHKWG